MAQEETEVHRGSRATPWASGSAYPGGPQGTAGVLGAAGQWGQEWPCVAWLSDQTWQLSASELLGPGGWESPQSRGRALAGPRTGRTE